MITGLAGSAVWIVPEAIHHPVAINRLVSGPMTSHICYVCQFDIVFVFLLFICQFNICMTEAVSCIRQGCLHYPEHLEPFPYTWFHFV